MPRYLIDVNLPSRLPIWQSEAFIHQREIDDEWTDEQIWDYAQANNLTVISKDSDFSHRILFHQPPPRIIHIKFGNMKMKPFRELIESIWQDVQKMSQTHKLVNIFKDRIEGIE